MYKNIIFMVAALLLTSCGVIPNTYLAAPISGTVIDKKTKQPLEGVIVAVYWNLHSGGLAGRRQTGLLHVEETVTDKNGNYHFKGWGPVATFSGRLGYESPQMLFAKEGYYFERKINNRTQMFFGKRGAGEIHVANAEETEEGVLYKSQWDGRNVKLEKGKYDDKFVYQLGFLSSDMQRIIRYGFDCKKKTIFGLLKHMKKEIEALDQRNIRTNIGKPYRIPNVKSCMSL